MIKIIGLTLLIFSFLLAFSFRFNHFYELTLLGLFLILSGLLKNSIFNTREAIITYAFFLLFGLFIDIPSQFLGLWHYSYSNLFEYLFLYLLIYPLGGIVMLQSFLFAQKILSPNRHEIKNINTYSKIVIFIGIILLVSVIFGYNLVDKGQWSILFMVSTVFFGYGVINFLSERFWNKSFLRDLLESPKTTLIITIVVMLLNAAIHEIPNTFAKQWIYTAKTGIVLDSLLANIPLYVWMGWSALAVGPIAFYYLSHNFFKKG